MKRNTTFKRLNALADLLDQVPAEDFNYNVWVEDETKRLVLKRGRKSCGTSGCALGWATTLPSFKRLGLHLNIDGEVQLGRDADAPCNYAPRNTVAAAKVFGINYAEVSHLFVPAEGEEYATPKQVAKKIRTFINNKRTIVELQKRRDRLKDKIRELEEVVVA